MESRIGSAGETSGNGPAMRVRRFDSRAELDAALAERIALALGDPGPGPAAVMLSGGSTPLEAYRRLARRPPPVSQGLYVLFSDERYVPSDDEASNYRQARPLIQALSLPEDRVLRARTELPLERAAEDYDGRLAALLSAGGHIGLGLLGLGADGHTASLFRMEDLARGQGRLAIAVQRPDGRGAVSVTPELLARVREPLFVVAGADKREALAALLDRRPDLVAWRAVAACPAIEVWADAQAHP